MQGKLIIEKEGKKQYLDTLAIEDISKIKSLNNKIRQKILRYLAKKPMYPSKLAEILEINEQTAYYHFKVLEKSGLIYVAEKHQIRGTIAKKYAIRNNSFSVILNDKPFKEYDPEIGFQKEIPVLLLDFIKDNMLDSKIVVGSPEPHGPHKSRAKDGHYAIDLGIFLGNSTSLSQDFSVLLDVGIDLKNEKNAIIVGGPVTNLTCYKINNYLPCKFSDKRPWGIITPKNTYTDDSIGMIAKIKNPFNDEGHILVIAGIKSIGTKSAVIAFTRNIERIIANNKIDSEFYCIVQGYDLDADGKIDSIEVLERSTRPDYVH